MLLFIIEAGHSNFSHSPYTSTCFFSSSVPSLLPNSLPYHPFLLFLKFHDLLLTPWTNDLLFFLLFPSFPSSGQHISSFCPSCSLRLFLSPFLCLYQVHRGFGRWRTSLQWQEEILSSTAVWLGTLIIQSTGTRRDSCSLTTIARWNLLNFCSKTI